MLTLRSKYVTDTIILMTAGKHQVPQDFDDGISHL